MTQDTRQSDSGLSDHAKLSALSDRSEHQERVIERSAIVLFGIIGSLTVALVSWSAVTTNTMQQDLAGIKQAIQKISELNARLTFIERSRYTVVDGDRDRASIQAQLVEIRRLIERRNRDDD